MEGFRRAGHNYTSVLIFIPMPSPIILYILAIPQILLFKMLMAIMSMDLYVYMVADSRHARNIYGQKILGTMIGQKK